MSLIDIAILILILFGALIGFKRGFTRELVDCVGLIACLVLAYLFKNPVSMFFYNHLPFFTFGGIIKGVTVLNILVYEVLAFLITFSIFRIILSVIKLVTKVFEGILKATIILGIPSKILGAIIGAIKWVIISYIVLFVLALPIFNTNYINESKICSKLLNYTPILSNITDKTLTVFNEFSLLKDKYDNKDIDVNQFNLDALDLFLKYDVIDIASADNLYQKGKFKTIQNIDSVLNKYRNSL